jgi:hypothetical protein
MWGEERALSRPTPGSAVGATARIDVYTLWVIGRYDVMGERVVC